MRCSPSDARRRASARPGLTLLEVIISTAIFSIALVAILRLVELGHERARDVRDLTAGLQKAKTKLAQVITGEIAVSSGTSGNFDSDEDPTGAWTWTLDTEAGALTGLYNVQITVQRARADGTNITVTLSEMVLDPQYRGSTIPQNNSSGGSAATGATGGN
jgi:type II secretion system protein I